MRKAVCLLLIVPTASVGAYLAAGYGEDDRSVIADATYQTALAALEKPLTIRPAQPEP